MVASKRSIKVGLLGELALCVMLVAISQLLIGGCGGGGGSSSSSPTWTISGIIVDASTDEVTVSLSGTKTAADTTNVSGYYSFSGLRNGTYTVTPSRPGYVFSPASRTVTISGADIYMQAFTFSPDPGILTLADAVDNSDLTWGTSGYANWEGQQSTSFDGTDAAESGTVGHNQYTDLFTSVTGPGTLSFYWKVSSESGYDGIIFYVNGSQDTSISGESAWLQETVTLGAGEHALTWRYVKDESVNSGLDKGWVDQVSWTPGTPTYSISGYVSGDVISGVTLTLIKGLKLITVTDSTGYFSFSNLADGVYSLTPSYNGATFTPIAYEVTISGGDVLNADFQSTATAPTYSISGSISGATISGVTLDLSGDGMASTTSDSSGNYTFTGLANGSYTIVPSKSGYDFSPTSRTVTVANGNRTGQSFFSSVNDDLIIGDLNMTLKPIPAGTFTMGSPSGEGNRSVNEGPQHSVTISQDFWMASTEITQSQYSAIVGQSPSQFSGNPGNPVEKVSWNDAVAFCQALTSREASAIPAGYEYRLPTEAEWEYACRAGTTTNFSYGQDNSYSNLGSYAWHAYNAGLTTHPVAQKAANPWGLYDMYGNVAEWVLDWFDVNYYSSSPSTDPTGPVDGLTRCHRGGGYITDPTLCRSASRDWSNPTNKYSHLGFRVVLAPVIQTSFSISGYIPAAGVTMTLSGTTDATTTTAGDGTYSFSGLGNGTYTVTPFQRDYAFIPGARSVTISGGDVSGVNFSQSSVNDKQIVDLRMSLRIMFVGSFTMGSPLSEIDRSTIEGPQHSVFFSQTFWMSRTEVTQAQYKAVVGSSPSLHIGDLSRPVESVTWNDAVYFCQLLTSRESGNIPAGYEYRLPTEAEWEYGCRAGTTTNFSYGQDNTYTNLDTYAWYSSNTNSTESVALKPPNSWGLYDMHGNVREWCHDYFAADYYSTSPGTNPTGPATGSVHVQRSASRVDGNYRCRSANRIQPLSVKSDYAGFRIVLAPAIP